jgi:histidinol phosphatase-like PHP family hydrolase
VKPVEALDRIAELLQRSREPAYRVNAFRKASREIGRVQESELQFLADNDRLTELPGVGDTTARVIKEALAGETPAYLTKLLASVPDPGTDAGEALRAKLKGDLHAHSDWSDGGDTIRVMAEKARDLGHEYLALTDHSPRLTIANGLSQERLREQLDVLAELNEELAPFRILSGVEVDILEDGALDWPDKILEQLDVVICSVHQRFKLDEEKQTARIRRALEHPLCGIWGHPTGRYLGDRDPLPARWEELIAIAAERGVTIECNGTPHRLDFSADLLRLARKHGAKVSLSVDAHSTKELQNLHYAVGTARRGWTERSRVVNARAADKFVAALHRQA